MPFGPTYAELPTAAATATRPATHYVDETSWSELIGNFSLWQGNVNANGMSLSNVVMSGGLTVSSLTTTVPADSSVYQITAAHASSGSQKAGFNLRIDGSNLWQMVADNSAANSWKLIRNETTTAVTVDQSSNMTIVGNVAAASCTMAGTAPSMSWQKTDAPVNQKNWIVQQTDTSLQIYMVTDVGGAPQVCFQLTRTAATPDTNAFKVWVGGSLKTLSVDGSGFVKAA